MSKAFAIENGVNSPNFDDDGKPERQGTLLTASAHIITAVIGSGVLSLAWAVAQLGWIAGPIILMVFSLVTWYASTLLADCYRNPTTGKRHNTYTEAVRSILGGKFFKLCGVAQYSILIGISIGYIITASISMAAVKRAICFHKNGHETGCHTSNNRFIIIFGVMELILSQIPNFHKLSFLSIIAAIMSFGYSFIGIGLSIAKVAGGSHARTTLTGVEVGIDLTRPEKVWTILTALGNIAFAYGFSMLLIEVQDTLRPNPPENVVMKKATSIAISITTIFYMLCGIVGYAAFGNDAPGNFLTGFGFYEPYWLVAIANIFIVVHLVGAFQVFVQPLFEFVESICATRCTKNKFITDEYTIHLPFCGAYNTNLFRLIWRSLYVLAMTIIAMLLPFFNDILGLIGALAFWPLTVFFPVEMYIVQANIRRSSPTWLWLKMLSYSCLVVSILAAIASIRGMAVSITKYELFHSVS
ncbi:hypothetical protein RND81_11G137600 [Saponaria officinalis]|uniref:Amino acid transporter transmembrane domain-containing protein n=1 Tax=Saponaria officinalis TaxID=3572 RepID=A0AAW1HLL8_SAPOF